MISSHFLLRKPSLSLVEISRLLQSFGTAEMYLETHWLWIEIVFSFDRKNVTEPLLILSFWDCLIKLNRFPDKQKIVRLNVEALKSPLPKSKSSRWSKNCHFLSHSFRVTFLIIKNTNLIFRNFNIKWPLKY